MFNHVLIPIDRSSLSTKAAKAGITMAKRLGASVTLYHAVEYLDPFYVDQGIAITPTMLKTLKSRVRNEGEGVLAEVEAFAEKGGVECESVLDEPVSAADGIVNAAKERR